MSTYGLYFIIFFISGVCNEFYIILNYVRSISLFHNIIAFLITRTDSQNRKLLKTSSFSNSGHKYKRTGLSESFSAELKNNLEYLMVTQKPYLNPQLRLDDIANLLNVSRHHASQVINENFKMRFYDYINRYRIEEAKKHIKDSSFYISEISYQCGFNNRVSFYNAFKKFTRTTPTEYNHKLKLCC